MDNAYLLEVNEVIGKLDTNLKAGLSESEARKRKNKYGSNELPPPPSTSFWRLVLSQFDDLLVKILLAAACVSFILGVFDDDTSTGSALIEPSVIMIILIINAIIGVVQESNAEKALEKLKEYTASEATVVRDGKTTSIDPVHLVPGDIVKISVGQKVPADLRLLSLTTATLSVDESMLTGEAMSVMKQTEPIQGGGHIVDQDKVNTLFSGTLCVRGRGVGVVCLTGTRTSIGQIQHDLAEQEEERTPLQQVLDVLAAQLSKIILAICILVWVINIGHFKDPEFGGLVQGAVYYFKIAVALAVAAIPEGLPAVVTTCLALGTMKMAKRNAIVRSLPSVETLGCTTVICSDKTGTLTTNKMMVQHVMVIDHIEEQKYSSHHSEMENNNHHSSRSGTRVFTRHYGVSGNGFSPVGQINDLNENIPLPCPGAHRTLANVGKIAALCNESHLTYQTKSEDTSSAPSEASVSDGALSPVLIPAEVQLENLTPTDASNPSSAVIDGVPQPPMNSTPSYRHKKSTPKNTTSTVFTKYKKYTSVPTFEDVDLSASSFADRGVDKNISSDVIEGGREFDGADIQIDDGVGVENGLEDESEFVWQNELQRLDRDHDEQTVEFGMDGEYKITGEPTEGALSALAEKISVPDYDRAGEVRYLDPRIRADFAKKYWEDQYEREFLLEFSRDRKSMSVLCRDANGQRFLFVKGAPESILKRCVDVETNDGRISPLTDRVRNVILGGVEDMGGRGLRILALASLTNPPTESDDDYTDLDKYGNIETNLTFVGLVGMLDPPRAEVRNAIRLCQTAAIRVIVITGDNRKTAEAICRRIGIFGDDEDISHKSYEGSEFMRFTETEQRDVVKVASLFSRVEPNHKMRLVKLLKEGGEVVAMTGDGVNDAPALKKADIGIAMGSGTAVAREASDMVLQDDNFSTIVMAVEQGRAIYANTKAFIRYLISSNIGEVICIFLTALLGIPDILIPVQLLWVNLVTDGPPATALGFNKPDKDVMQQPPRGRNSKIIDGWMFFRYVAVGMYIGVATVVAYMWWHMYYDGGPQMTFEQLSHWHSCGPKNDIFKDFDCDVFTDHRQKHASTVGLSVLVTIEMFNTFNALSENQSLLVIPPWDNNWVSLAVLASIGTHCFILYVPFLKNIFKTAPLNFDEWIMVLIISFPVIILDEILKIWSRRKQASHVVKDRYKTH